MEQGRFTLKGFQRNIVMRFIAITAAGGLISLFLFYVMTRRRLDEIFYTFHLPKSIDEFLLPYVVAANLAGLFMVMISLVFAMKSTFWRVAGPLYRVSQDIKKLIDGDLTVVIRLRKDDEFKDMAEGFDKLGRSMRERFKEIKGLFNELSNTVSDMAVSHYDKELLRQKNDRLKKNIEGLRGELDAFKIK